MSPFYAFVRSRFEASNPAALLFLRAQVLLFLFRPNDAIAAHVARAMARLDAQHAGILRSQRGQVHRTDESAGGDAPATAWRRRGVLAMHVRHGKKKHEGNYVELEHYLAAAARMRAHRAFGTVLLMTDDKKVLRKAMAGSRDGSYRARYGFDVLSLDAPSTSVHGYNPYHDAWFRATSGTAMARYGRAFGFGFPPKAAAPGGSGTGGTGPSKGDAASVGQRLAVEALVNIYLAAVACDAGLVGTFSSNYSRVILLLMLALRGRLPPNTSMDSWRYSGMPVHTVPATRGRFPAYTHVYEGGALRNRLGPMDHTAWMKFSGSYLQAMPQAYGIDGNKTMWARASRAQLQLGEPYPWATRADTPDARVPPPPLTDAEVFPQGEEAATKARAKRQREMSRKGRYVW